jgi:hypothetical protein
LVIKSSTSNNRQHNGQKKKGKHWSIKHYTQKSINHVIYNYWRMTLSIVFKFCWKCHSLPTIQCKSNGFYHHATIRTVQEAVLRRDVNRVRQVINNWKNEQVWILRFNWFSIWLWCHFCFSLHRKMQQRRNTFVDEVS